LPLRQNNFVPVDWPPAPIDANGDTISSETGTFTLREVELTGAQAPTCDGPCTGSSVFEIRGGAIVATGSFGTKVISLDEIRGVAGVARAPLASIAARPLVCGQAYQTFTVTLAAPAPAGGERVDVTATIGRIAPGIVVPPGATSADLHLATPAAYRGSVSVSAAAGGVQKRASLSLDCRAR